MSEVTYHITKEESGKFITIVVPGQNAPLVIRDDHPYFDKILDLVLKDAEPSKYLDLIDIAEAASKKFNRLSERVSVKQGKIFLDGDELDNALTTAIVRFIDEEVDDWKPLVRFLENVYANPSENSRKMLYLFLNSNKLTITDEGYFIAYKGVEADGLSRHSGRAFVNGEEVVGRIPNAPGDTIEMPRSVVVDDPRSVCHIGLHIAGYSFANNFGSGETFEVHVHPRDVVSVPNNGEKIRVCRYKVVGPVKKHYEEILLDEKAPETPAVAEKSTTKEVKKSMSVATPDQLVAGDTIPSKKRFDKILDEAKSRKKGILKVVGKHKLVYIGEDPKDRRSYRNAAK